jgi:hypothetical protein
VNPETRDHPSRREYAYNAAYRVIAMLGDQLPPDPVHRNAMIWRAVNAALDAYDAMGGAGDG